MRYGDTFTDGRVTEESILRLVNERRREGENFYRNFFQRTKSWYNIYRGIYTGNFGMNKNNVNIPILFSQVMSDVANKTQAIFADPEVIQFIPNSDYDGPIAKKNSNLVNIQLSECDSYVKAVDFFMSASIYGTGIARSVWKLDRKTRLFRVNMMGQEKIFPSVQTCFDGPNWEVCDILDVIFEHGKRRLEDCNYVIHTYYIDLDDLLEMQSGDGLPMFSQDAVMKLLDSGMGADARDAWKTRNTIYRTMTDMANRGSQGFGKPVRIDEYWGKVPSEFGIQGDRNLVITVANEKVVLRYEPNPFYDHHLPFLIYTPMPDPHALHGTGKCEIAEKLQAMINKLANIKLDALEIFANPMHVVRDDAEIDGQNLASCPGKLIKVRGDKVQDSFMPLSPDIRALQLTYEEIQSLAGFQQQGTGISADVIQGLGGEGGDRETAHSVMSRKDAALGRLAAESVQAEHMFIVPLAQRFKNLNSQLLPLPKQIQIIGQDAIMDPETGMPLIGPQQTVNYDDLQYEHKCRALGASRLMSKSILAQQLLTYMNTAGANPAMAGMINWVNFNKVLCRALNLNPTELLVQQVNVPQINLAAMQGGSAGAGPGQNPMGQQSTDPGMPTGIPGQPPAVQSGYGG